MNNLVFGKYIPIKSPIHDLDPRAKIAALFVMIAAVFIPKSWYCYALLGVIILGIVLLSHIKITMILKALKPTMFMMAFLLIINCLTVKTGTVLLSYKSFVIYSDAVLNTLFIVVRLLLMIMLTTILTATTKPLDLTLGIESLLSPLKVIHFPYHEIAMMISIALRFIPTIIEETMRIMNSQKSRGVDFEEGKLREKINAILSLIIPLFTVAFQRAFELADAMEARGYVPDQERTKYHTLKFRFKDFLFLLFAHILLALMILSRFYL
ncbi:MAG: energy-coupling factor transporter transmembrane protein EcfT [Erysipelotrichaceae bacterium]|nr:energy-coupling factor transporter transmembrane protein EcfT [Erysipelotrichaceae bacterium]